MKHQVFFLEVPADCGFSAPIEAGMDALMMNYPAEADISQASGSVTFVNFSRDAQQAMEMDAAGLMDYVSMVFLAYSGEYDESERVIFGQHLKGRSFRKSIPRAATTEIFLLKGPEESLMAVGIVKNDDAASELNEALERLLA